MRLPNLLGTPRGRLVAFFFLYITEGIPLGFVATAIATQMRRQGVGVAEIGALVAAFYIPWSFKWAMGPIVDLLGIERWGRRRVWIIFTQLMMAATLMVALPINFATQLSLFTTLVIVHNIFGATQDVAIDALAVNSLSVSERGLANGLMFGGAYLGQAIGGSGVLFLAPLVGFRNTYFFVAGFILLVTLFVVLPMREPKSEPLGPSAESPLLAAFRRIVLFVTESVRSFFSSRGAFVGVLFALLPAGAYALGLALQSNLAVELGLSDPQVAGLNLWSSIASALGCVVGGWLSDRFGRRKMITLFIVGSAIPTAILAMQMKQAGWVLPLAPDMLNRPVPPLWLVQQFWLMTIAYSVFQGLMYGTRTAMFMDVTNPKVAATQFTAYMAMLNFVISYTARWQGVALAKWGYPVTLGLDAAAGLVCLLALPFMAPRRAGASSPAPGAAVEPATG